MNKRGEKVTKGFVVRVKYDGKDRLGRPASRVFHARAAADVLADMMRKAHPQWDVWVSEEKGFDKIQEQAPIPWS